MNLTTNQKSWSVSIILHILVLSFISSVIHHKVLEQKQTVKVPVTLNIVKAPPKPKKKPQVIPKKQKLISKKAAPISKKVSKPTSLPGDRTEPILVKQLVPVYPKEALNNDWEGEVKVEVIISPNGKVTTVKVLKSSGFDVLDRSFIRTVKDNYQFEPKRTMGKNVKSKVIISHAYKIGEAV